MKAKYTDEELIHILCTITIKDKWTREALNEAAKRLFELSPDYIKSPVSNNYYHRSETKPTS